MYARGITSRPANRRGRWLLELAHVPFHFQTCEPFYIARQIGFGLHAAASVGGREGIPLLDDLLARTPLGIHACIVAGAGGARGSAQAAQHAFAGVTGVLDIDFRDLARLLVELG